MPIILLLRQFTTSKSSLAAIVEKSQHQQLPLLEYDIQLKTNQLNLILLTKTTSTSLITSGVPDEGFESDIDTISIISSENESSTFNSIEKINNNNVGIPSASSTTSSASGGDKNILTETDSANGGSGTESETEIEKSNTLTSKNVNSIKESFDKLTNNCIQKETFDLVDCVCYSDINYPDILIFVIKCEALVFKFDNLVNLKTFYTNFTTLKAVTNHQKTYHNINRNVATTTKYNLLQRTDQNGVTHIEIKKQNNKNTEDVTDNADTVVAQRQFHDVIVHDTVDKSNNTKIKDVNLRQRAESKMIINDMQLLNDIKFNTINNKVCQKKMMVRSSSIENLLNGRDKESNLVKNNGDKSLLRKVWNSAEDLLDSTTNTPRRPERRKKKKPAPQPPLSSQSPPSTATNKIDDIFSGQFVRVNVNLDNLPASDKNHLVIKSNVCVNEPHPKKFTQNFNISTAKNNFTSFLKSKIDFKNGTQQILKYHHQHQPHDVQTLNRTTSKQHLYEKNNSWTNSVPRILKKNGRSKSETRYTPQQQNFQPMAYRYIDTTLSDYGFNQHNNNNNNNYNNSNNNNNALFLTTNLKTKFHHTSGGGGGGSSGSRGNIDTKPHCRISSYVYNVPKKQQQQQHQQENSIGNRIFGLTPKLKDFTTINNNNNNNNNNKHHHNKWGSVNDLTLLNGYGSGWGGERNNNNLLLKSSIKNGTETGNGGSARKKNEKKVTFSAYATVQVV